MAKLMTFMYANESRNEIVNGQNIQTISNPLLALKPMFIPGQLSFSIIFGITDFEFGKEHTFQYKLTAPDGKIAIDSGIISLPSNLNAEDQKLDGFIGSFDLRNVAFLVEGIYKTELLFDGVKLKDDTISIAEAGIDGGNITG